MKKRCGGCTHWVKWKKSWYGLSSDGLCGLQDWRCPSDYSCALWEGKKYERVKVKLVEEQE
ncbi:hypothetical protein [Pseudomonas phage vB_PsaM_M1]|nr:hypothetical protein [Pseudomonas phage vB_PsaM_M1]